MIFFHQFFEPLFLQVLPILSFISLAVTSSGSWDFILYFSCHNFFGFLRFYPLFLLPWPGSLLHQLCYSSVPSTFGQETHLDPCWDLFPFKAIFPCEKRRILLSSRSIFRCFLLQFNIHWSPLRFLHLFSPCQLGWNLRASSKALKKCHFSMKKTLSFSSATPRVLQRTSW